MQSPPLVSVIINNFNYARFLGEAIESALDQTCSNIEVVVVDDGSTDNSLEVIESFGSRIVAVSKSNGGQGSAFNAGFAASKGEIICFLDSDDLFVQHKAARVAQIFSENIHIGWCWDIERKFQNQTMNRLSHSQAKHFGLWDARKQLADGEPPIIPTACSGLSFRREILDKILPVPDIFRIADGYVKIAALGLSPGWLEADELTLQRIHDTNIYTNQPQKRRRLAGRVGLLIGVCLTERFPTLKRTGLHMATRGLGMCWATHGVDSDCKPLLEQFLHTLTPQARAAFFLQSAYWALRRSLHL